MTNEHKPDNPSANGSQNGADPRAGTPSLNDLVMQFGGARPDIVRDMMTTSRKPEEYIPRSILTAEEAALIRRLTEEEYTFESDEPMTREIIWLMHAQSEAQDGGRARRDVVEMHTGERRSLMGKVKEVMTRSSQAEGQPQQGGPAK